MKKKVVLPIALLFGAMASYAGPITCEQAAENVTRFLSGQSALKFSRSLMTVTSTDQGLQPYYIFNIGDDGGFVIASGDDAAYSILGYSFKGHLDVNNMPENMKAWLDGYARELAYIQKLNLPAAISTASTYAEKRNIPALVETQWAQDYPYHKLTPDFGDGYGSRPTGCVATAIAQVLNFHQWPEGATGQVAAYEYKDDYPGGDGSTKKIEALEPTVIDWDGMQYTYSYDSDVRAIDAVAKLMQYVGHSVKMVYGPYSSGAYASDIVPAMTGVFGYKDTAKLLYREYESQEGWNNIIYNEIANNRPVVYFGATRSFMGHQFVCDGYENGFFHINWGWAGTSDGFFKLSVLNPQDQGTGGAGFGESFSEYQNAVIGLEKPVNADRIYGTTVMSAQNAEIPLCIKMDRLSDNLVGAEFDLTLPEGVTLKSGADGMPEVTFDVQRSEGGDHKVNVKKQENGKYHFTVSSASQGKLIVSTGALVRMSVILDRGVKDAPEAKLSNVVVKDAFDYEKKLEDSSFHINYYKVTMPLYGDANDDGKITGADVKCLMDYIMYLFPKPFNFELADIIKDSSIDVADVTSVADIVLQDAGLNRNFAETEISKEDVLSFALGEKGVELVLTNQTQYKALQLDVVLPAGMKLKDVETDAQRMAGFDTKFVSIADGVYRLVVRASDNANIAGHEGTLLYFITNQLPEEVKVANVMLVTSDLRKVKMPDLTYEVPTGIDEIAAAETKDAAVYTLDGVRVKGNLKHLPQGVYVVNGHKVMVK